MAAAEVDMKTFTILLLGCLTVLSGSALSQEVVITDFPIGVAGSVNQDIFKPYYSHLRVIADILNTYPLSRAVITGGADGEEYRENHDAKNPSLALGRAHILANLMIDEFNVDSTQLIIQSKDVSVKGGQHRYVSIRIDRELSELDARLSDIEDRPPAERHTTEIREVSHDIVENLRLHVGIGFSTSPFGGLPVVTAGISWKRVFFMEGIAGHTFWNDTFRFENIDLDTKRRIIGGYLIAYPLENIPVGILGGWIRVEEISDKYYKYVKLSEGPVLGLRFSPVNFISITGAYNPARHRIVDDFKSKAKNGQFMAFITAHLELGGQK
jgi:hypothetical protein